MMAKNKFVNTLALRKALANKFNVNLEYSDVDDMKTAIQILKSGIKILDIKQNELEK